MSTPTIDNGNLNLMDSQMEAMISPVTKILCYLVIPLALVFMASLSVAGLLIGLILLGVSLAFITASKRVAVDFEHSLYREYVQVFGFKIGEWKKLIECKVITITSSTQTFSNNLAMGGAQTYSNSHSFNLNLKKDNYKKIVVANGSYDEMVEKARIASVALNDIDIMDYTVKPAVQLN
jgi:hypothetical protein